MLNLPTQHKLGILHGLVVEQPVQFCPLCRGVAVFVLHDDAVNGKGGAIGEPGFYPVGVHVVAAPNHENPNLFSIGEGFGFFVFFGNENSGSSLTAVCPKPYQKKDRITKVTTVKVP